MVEIIGTTDFEEWYLTLSDQETQAVDRYVTLLEMAGVALGHPYSSAIKGSQYALRELRPTAGRAEIRVLYAFDPARSAVLLIGGSKTGDDRFYQWIIPLAEQIWEEYLDETGQSG